VRREPGKGRAVYLPFDQLDQVQKSPFAVISLRNPSLNTYAATQFPNAKRLLWLHDFNQQEIVKAYPELKGTGTKIVCVSRTHKQLVADALISQIGVVEGLTATHVYNPIGDDLQPDSTPVDHKKLVFFSSPHKGLEHALYLFGRLRDIDPSYTLHVANPGYLPSAALEGPGVVSLGTLNHSSVVGVVRGALAVFHPNLVFPETFGLVHAEANAVGTPALTAGIGANREILGSSSGQILDVRDEKLVVQTIQRWSRERPVVKGRDEFRLTNVLNSWEALLDG
jgi:glycosyltransferase involved in cell wall biosynthesis